MDTPRRNESYITKCCSGRTRSTLSMSNNFHQLLPPLWGWAVIWEVSTTYVAAENVCLPLPFVGLRKAIVMFGMTLCYLKIKNCKQSRYQSQRRTLSGGTRTLALPLKVEIVDVETRRLFNLHRAVATRDRSTPRRPKLGLTSL